MSVAKKMGLPWDASSRALAIERGVNNVGPMATTAIKTLEAMGICDAERCSRLPAQVTMSELEQADDCRPPLRRASAAVARAISLALKS